jgi:hypothetical protein
MKFSTLLIIPTFIGSTLAAPWAVEKRDDSGIRDSLTRTSNAVQEVTRFLKAHYHPNGKSGFFNEAIQRQRNLNRFIREETDNISRAQSVSALEWFGLRSITDPLASNHMDCATAWIALRDSSPPWDREILSVLQETLSEGVSYTDILWTKTGYIAGVLSNTSKSQYVTTWNRAIQAYKSTSSFGAYNPGDVDYYGNVVGGSQGYNQGSNQGSYPSQPNNPGSFSSQPTTITIQPDSFSSPSSTFSSQPNFQGSNQGSFGGYQSNNQARPGSQTHWR